VVEHPLRKRLLRLTVPATAATVATGAVVSVAVAAVGDHSAPAEVDRPVAAALHATAPSATPSVGDRLGAVSRSAKRVTLQEKPDVVDHQFMTAPLNLWSQPREAGRPLDVLTAGGTVALTGEERHGFAQILLGGQLRWVNATYLSEHKPRHRKEHTDSASSAPTSGVSTAPCPDGSATESGLTPSAVTLYRAVCNAFPALTSYGGYDDHGEHSSGKAIDFMINGDSSLGQAIADWAVAHAAELGLYDVIWAQHIWTPERASEGWRAMPDRGSATANHYDHVHISVN
jgi:cytochrome c5